MSTESNNMITWERLQMEAEGKLSIQMKDGEQLFLQTTGDGKVEVVGADGELRLALSWIGLVDPNDPVVIEVAKKAAEKNNAELESVMCGVYVNVVAARAYVLLISAKDNKGAKNVYFTATVKTFSATYVVVAFQYVMPYPI